MLPSWEVSLRADRKSPQTIKSYGDGVRRFLFWCGAQGRVPTLDRPSINGWVADLLDAGAAPATAHSRQRAVRRFSAWLTAEGEQAEDALLGMKPPKLDVKVVEPMTEAQIKALIKACAGADLRDRRDEALVRFMIETGARATETVQLKLSDVDVVNGVAIIRQGKGGKGRSVPFGVFTGQALDRYIRTRRSHRLADTDALWVGDRGKSFSYDGLHKTLGERAARAGVPGFHPHLMRHTAAHRWLAAGGSEGGLMAVCGWTRPEMLVRYTKAQAANRAAAEARSLSLGNF
jgi:integrase/recombinase XerD